MKAYSLDLRQKILQAYDQGRGSQRALAAWFGVSRGFVEQLMQRRRTTGENAPRPYAGGRRPYCDPPTLALVRHLVQAQPDATLAELRTQLRQQRGVRLLYLPPYSPDLSSMELCVSMLKTALRAAKARTREALETAIRAAMDTVTGLDAYKWFRHCGYAL